MKSVFATALLALAAAAPLPGIAADHGHGDHADHAAMMAKGNAQMVDGVVKKVDKSAGKVTLAHGPLQNLGMPAMTMAFPVKDAAWLGGLKEGDKVRFMADTVNGAITVVHLEAAK